MSSTLQKTKKRKPKRKPTREDDIPQDLKFGPFARFLFSKELCRDFISSVALYKPEENQDEKKKEKKEEKKEKKTVNKQVSKYLKQKNPFFFFSATPVHRAWGDDIVELLQDRLPWGQDQQDSIEWACCAAFSKVIEEKKTIKVDFLDGEISKNQTKTLLAQVCPKLMKKSGQNTVVFLTSRCNIVVFQVQRRNCDWQSLQSVRHTEHWTGGPSFQCKEKRSHLHNCNCSQSHYYSKVVPTELLMAFSMSMKGSGNADKTLFKFLII